MLERTQEIIRSSLQGKKNPIVATSFGKDSLVLLHILLQMGYKFPCIFFKEPFMPKKYAFANAVILAWDLQVYDWRPQMTAVQQNGDEFEIQNYYSIGGGHHITCPTGILPPKEGEPFLCAYTDLYNKPVQTGELVHSFDLCLVGHRGDDTDPIYGDAGTEIEYRVNPESIDLSFPLAHWSEDDIWQYIHEHKVPYDKARYPDRQQLEDISTNPDYFHACTRCMDQRGPAFVECPKLGMKIENISSRLRFTSNQKLSYMKGYGETSNKRISTGGNAPRTDTGPAASGSRAE